MNAQAECRNCGAVLMPEDAFCGECGAPRPSTMEVPGLQPPAGPPVGQAPTAPPITSGHPTPRDNKTGWRVAFFALVVFGALACLAGLLAFLLMGLTESEVSTPQENWVYSALCCLVPLGGTGAILVTTGVAIWYARLRERITST